MVFLDYHLGATLVGMIIAANRLPATLAKTPRGWRWQPSPGGMAAALTPVQKKLRATWLGWNGLQKPMAGLPPLGKNLHGLFIDPTTYDKYYHAVANGALWPMFHGLRADSSISSNDWQAYQQVNSQFAEAIAKRATLNDMIWIHDYHLLLVPGMLRKRGIGNRIGLFLHIPFAELAKIKNVPHIHAILSSLAQADLCGVQSERDMRNLSLAFKELLPLKKRPKIQTFPIGIDQKHYQSAMQQKATRNHLQKLTPRTAAKFVVLSVSRLDYTKGIIEQIHAVERAAGMGLRNVFYKLIVAPSRDVMASYKALKEQIDQEVARVNAKLPGTIEYKYENVEFSELCAWYARADVLLVTPIADGMNLVAKEFLLAKPSDQSGVVILSHTAGAAQQLKQALLVRPTDVPEIAQALLAAQNMPDAERIWRTEAIRQNVRNQDVFWWAERFIDSLKGSS